MATSRNNLSSVLKAQGKVEEAETEQRRALAIWKNALGPEHGYVAMAQINLAHLVWDRGEVQEALLLAQRAWTRRHQDDVPLPEQAEASFLLARALLAVEGELDSGERARELARGAIDAYLEAGPEHAGMVEKIERWLRSHRRP